MTEDGGGVHRGLQEKMAGASHRKIFPGASGEGVESCLLFLLPMAKWLVLLSGI